MHKFKILPPCFKEQLQRSIFIAFRITDLTVLVSIVILFPFSLNFVRSRGVIRQDHRKRTLQHAVGKYFERFVKFKPYAAISNAAQFTPNK